MPVDNSVSVFAPMKMFYISGLMFMSDLIHIWFHLNIRGVCNGSPSSEPALDAEALRHFC